MDTQNYVNDSNINFYGSASVESRVAACGQKDDDETNIYILHFFCRELDWVSSDTTCFLCRLCVVLLENPHDNQYIK